MQVIIFPNDKGWVSVITPSPNAGMTIEEIATKDVPDGKPYEIVDHTTLPESPQELWTWV
jgi:hypothetical protein